MTRETPTGVLLLNLGGPERPEDVEPFLINLFSDRMIIRLGPPFLQGFIARRIARKRAPASRANYAKIGGGSPLVKITLAQARALEEALAEDGNYLVRPCMRYWPPDAAEAVQAMRQARVRRLIALPLYPQYSIATTGSSLADLRSHLQRHGHGISLEAIGSWPTQPSYIEALARRIRNGLDSFGRDRDQVQVVYSAHSLPQKFIDEGDPYVDELHQTIRALEEKTRAEGILCFQSRSGPVKWLGPSTPETIDRLAANGCRHILMVPIAFVSDHVETLYEIDILYREQARRLGLRLESTPGLNDDPLFIQALRELVLEKTAAASPGTRSSAAPKRTAAARESSPGRTA